MTREEAVERIKDHIEIHGYHERNAVKIFEALDMAIKALEQPEQPEIIRCKDCMHNGSYDTDCPIDWNGKEYCNFAERMEEGEAE